MAKSVLVERGTGKDVSARCAEGSQQIVVNAKGCAILTFNRLGRIVRASGINEGIGVEELIDHRVAAGMSMGMPVRRRRHVAAQRFHPRPRPGRCGEGHRRAALDGGDSAEAPTSQKLVLPTVAEFHRRRPKLTGHKGIATVKVRTSSNAGQMEGIGDATASLAGGRAHIEALREGVGRRHR